MFGGQFGAGNVYNKETGGLVGVIYRKQKVAKGEPRFTAALNYVADDGEQASSPKACSLTETPRQHHCSDWLRHQAVGRCARLPLWPVWCQVRHRLANWKLPLAASYGTPLLQSCGSIRSTRHNVDSQNFALNGFWKPEETGLDAFHSGVSAGYGWLL